MKRAGGLSEAALQKAVCAHLDVALPSSAYYCAVPNGAVLSGDAKARGMQMSKLKATGLKPGAPDLVICWSGRFIGIELKSPTGTVSKPQEAAADRITLAGGLYTVARSVEAVESFLTMIGVPLRARILL